MARIHELVPLLEFGSIELGRKVKREVPITDPPQQIVLRRGDCTFMGLDRVSCTLAVVKDEATVVLANTDGATYWEFKSVAGLAINQDPLLKGKLRFSPTVSVSVIGHNNQKLHLPRNL